MGSPPIMRDGWRKAAIAGDHRVMADLLAAGTSIDALDRYGQTALMLAAMHGRDEVVALLLEHGADPDVTAKYGLSALMLAVVNHHDRIAHWLVDAGADTSLRATGAPGFAGMTARDLAEDRGLEALVAHIERASREGRTTADEIG